MRCSIAFDEWSNAQATLLVLAGFQLRRWREWQLCSGWWLSGVHDQPSSSGLNDFVIPRGRSCVLARFATSSETVQSPECMALVRLATDRKEFSGGWGGSGRSEGRLAQPPDQAEASVRDLHPGARTVQPSPSSRSNPLFASCLPHPFPVLYLDRVTTCADTVLPGWCE